MRKQVKRRRDGGLTPNVITWDRTSRLSRGLTGTKIEKAWVGCCCCLGGGVEEDIRWEEGRPPPQHIFVGGFVAGHLAPPSP